jgi:multiple sugar transport system ATP-binding protein
MASVTFEHVTKRYTPETTAVDDLTLEVRDEEFMVLVGPSGCGKSTALRMLAGLEAVTEGKVKIGDAAVNRVPAGKRDVAMVFQTYALYPHMTAYDNMAFGLKMRGVPRSEIRPRVSDAAAFLGLQDMLGRKPRQLSGGQRQRVALGRAIVRHPKVFLLDEPLSNLDAKLRAETRVNLQRIHQQLRTTFVYVTHDQIEAMTMGDRIAVLLDGVLQQVAPPQEIYQHPKNMYVAGFIGSPTMNFIPATVQGTTATASGFTVELPRNVGSREAILGLRPEAIGFRTDGRPTMRMRVEVVEAVGSDQFLYGSVGGEYVVARVDPDVRVGPGHTAELGIDVRRLHVFDKTTELSLL